MYQGQLALAARHNDAWITLSTRPIPTQDPVSCTCSCLAYLDQNVARGWHNPRVKGLARGREALGRFKSGVQMLHSPNEFFASSAATVLYGRWPVEPFERAKVRDELPVFFNWVVSEFVTDAASFNDRARPPRGPRRCWAEPRRTADVGGPPFY